MPSYHKITMKQHLIKKSKEINFKWQLTRKGSIGLIKIGKCHLFPIFFPTTPTQFEICSKVLICRWEDRAGNKGIFKLGRTSWQNAIGKKIEKRKKKGIDFFQFPELFLASFVLFKFPLLGFQLQKTNENCLHVIF